MTYDQAKEILGATSYQDFANKLAELTGTKPISRQAVHKWAKRGWIPERWAEVLYGN